METRVRISGYKELAREIGRVGPAYKKRLRAINRAIAVEVRDDARRRYVQHFTSRSGHSLNTIRALGAQARASVAIGNAAEPHLGAQEFGSETLANFRPRTPKGKFLYPAIGALADDRIERYADELEELLADAFPDRVA